jgi:hypothetical protein
MHSLRLGFFREEVSAEAVSGYLKTFFQTPTVVRISIAEQGRFKDAPTAKGGAKAKKVEAKILDLNHARPAVPVVTLEVPRGDTGASGRYKTSNTGKHKALTAPKAKPAAKAVGPAVKQSDPVTKTRTSTTATGTGKYKVMRKQSLEEQLLNEAREVQLNESGIRKLPKSDSLLSRIVGKLTK